MTGLTIKQYNEQLFLKALDAYEKALIAKDKGLIVSTSIAVHSARQSKKHAKMVRRVWNKYNSKTK